MHLFFLYVGGNFDDAERSIVNLLSSFDRSQIDRITLIAPMALRACLSQSCDVFMNVDLFRLETEFNDLGSFHRDVQTVSGLLRNLEPDIAFGMMHYSSALVVFGARMAGVQTRTIANYRTPFYEYMRLCEKDHGWRQFLQSVVAETASLADRIIVVSQGISDELQQRFYIPLDRICVIYDGIDLGALFDGSESIDLEQDGVSILCTVSQSSSENNLDFLLEAFRCIRSKLSAVFVVISDESERKKIEDKATEYGVSDVVKFLGCYGDVYPCIWQADVFIHVRQYEGFSNSILEALAYGIVVVATDCPYGPREILDDGKYGVLASTNNPDELSNAVLKLLADPAACQMLAARGLDRAKQFSIQKMVGSYQDVFLGLIGRGGVSDIQIMPRYKNLYFNLFYNKVDLSAEIGLFKFVNICVITYNRFEYTQQVFDALFNYTDFPYVLTVIDNGSIDRTVDYLRFLHQRNLIKNLILFDSNVGVAKAGNVGWICEQEADYYIKLDNDVVMQGAWLADMVKVCDAIPQLGAVGYNVESCSFPLSTTNGYSIRIKEQGNLGGACILIPKSIHQKLGFWCEDYGLYGEEDADYGQRINCAGLINVYMENEDLAFHLPSGTNAGINPIDFRAIDSCKEYLHGDYQRWKDQARHQNVFGNTVYNYNINGYQSGTKSLYVESRFVRQWLLSRGSEYRSNNLWFNELYRVKSPTPCHDGKNMSLSVVFSTRAIDQKFINHIRNTVGVKDVEVIPYVNNNEFSLTEIYNRGLRESKSEIVLFVHDDVIFNKNGWGKALLSQFRDTDYGILGIAGATGLIQDNHGIALAWWSLNHRCVGRIKHESKNNREIIDSHWSNQFDHPIPVICLDGVFIAVNKNKIRKYFDEEFKGFHYYDISFTFSNYLAGTKVGVTFEIDLTHKSVGNSASPEWKRNQIIFSRKYEGSLPYELKIEKVEYANSVNEKLDFRDCFVSIIIPTKDKIELLIDCIQSIIEHTCNVQYEIIIADTGSAEFNRKRLCKWIDDNGKRPSLYRIRIIDYDYYNFAKINNDVVKNYLSGKCNYIVFCNNDIKLLNDAIDQCLLVFKRNKNVGTVGIRLHYKNNSIQHNGIEIVFGLGNIVGFTHRNKDSYYKYDRDVVEVVGNTAAFLMIERSIFEKYYFNENYQECFEDVELNLEMLRLGRKNYQVGQAVAYHYESQSRNDNPDKHERLVQDYLNNLLPFFKKNCVPIFFAQLFKGASNASKLGYYKIAEEICELLLENAPHHSDVHHLLGVVFGRQGNQDKSVRYIRQAISLNNKMPSYHYNLAEALRLKGELVGSEQSYRQALQLAPKMVDAYIKLAIVLEQQGRLDEAIVYYQKGLQIKPDHALAYCGIGDILRQQGVYDHAISCYQRALQIQPDLAVAHHDLGVLLNACNRFDEAIACFQQALRYKPDWGDAWSNLGMLQEQNGLIEEARECYRHVLSQEPNQPLLRLRVNSLCTPVFMNNQAIQEYRNGLKKSIDDVAKELNELEDKPLDLRRLHASRLDPPLLLAYQGDDDRPIKEAWSSLFEKQLPKIGFNLHTSRLGKPHIGIVVTRGHEGIFIRGMGGILEKLSTKYFDITVVCTSQGGVATLRPSIKNAAIHYLSLPERIDRAVKLLAEAQFQLLYFWEVGTDSINYFIPFFQLASVQCTGWGWPVTSGIPQMHYYLSNQYLEVGDSNSYYSEQLVKFRRLPTYFLRPEHPKVPMDREKLGLAKGQHLYLCVQNLRKIHPDFDLLVAGLLRKDPSGILVLIEDKQQAITTALRKRFQSNLPDVVGQIRFVPRLVYQDYLSLLMAADVVLDTIHYGGAITAYDTFAVNTPIVTLPTMFSRGRYVYAAYQQMGIEGGIAIDPNDYIEKAFRFASEADYKVAFCNQLWEASAELFEDDMAVNELEEFLQRVLESGHG